MGLLGSLIAMPSKGSIQEQWERSGSLTFRAAYTTDCDYNYVRNNCTYLPTQAHPTDSGQLITQIDVEQDGEAGLCNYWDYTNLFNAENNTPCYWWTITVTYGPLNPLEVTLTGNPVNQPISFAFQWEIYEQAVDIAVTGKNSDGSYIYSPVINSAGFPFDPPVTRDGLRGVIRISQNVLSFSPGVYFLYGNCINNDTWNGFAPYTVKMSPPNMPERLWSQYLGQNYYRLDYEFHFNPDPGGWNATPIDRGYVARNSSGIPYKIVDLNGQPVSQPALLNGSGGELINPSSSNYHAFNFQVYNDIPFGSTFPAFSSLFP